MSVPKIDHLNAADFQIEKILQCKQLTEAELTQLIDKCKEIL